MLKSEINDLLTAEAVFTPTFDPFLPLAVESNTMIGEDGAHFPADPFIAVISHYFPPSKKNKLDFTPKNISNLAMMKVGNHKKRQDLERLNTAAQAGLGSDTPLTIIVPVHQKGSEPAKAATLKN